MSQPNELELIKQRLTVLEKQMESLQEDRIVPPAASVSESPKMTYNQKKYGHPEKQSVPSPSKKSPEPKESQDWEQVIGRTWLPRIFIFVFLLGVVWGFNAAIEYNIISEPIRCLIGIVTAVALLFLGEKQIQKNHSILGQTLLGGAIVVLMLSTFAAHTLYDLIPTFFAYGLNIAWILSGLYLAHKHRSESLAILSSTGGTLIPFMLEGVSFDLLNVLVLELLLFIVFYSISFAKKYHVLHGVSSLLFYSSLSLMIVLTNVHIDTLWLIGVFALLHHLVLLSFCLAKKETFDFQTNILFGSALISFLFCYMTAEAFALPFIYLGFSLIYFTFYLLSQTNWYSFSSSFANLSLAISTYASFVFLLDVFSEKSYLLILLLAQSCVFIWLGVKNKSSFHINNGYVVFIFSSVMFLPSIFGEIEHFFSMDTLSWCAYIGAVSFIRILLNKENKETRHTLDIIIAFLILAFITHITVCLTENLSGNTSLMAVSAVWGMYATLSVLLGKSIQHNHIKKFGVILIFVSLAKLVMIDFPSVSAPIRAILFLGLGSLGLLMSRLFHSKK